MAAKPQGGDRRSQHVKAQANLILHLRAEQPTLILSELRALLAKREDWFEAQDELHPDTLVFLDETATTTNMVRRYGWAAHGERCRVAVPHGHWKTTTVTAALRTSGVTATALFDGATNGQRIRAYLADTLILALKRNDTVILDNLGALKVAGVRKANFMAVSLIHLDRTRLL